jgi:hypothetical protein
VTETGCAFCKLDATLNMLDSTAVAAWCRAADCKSVNPQLWHERTSIGGAHSGYGLSIRDIIRDSHGGLHISYG